MPYQHLSAIERGQLQAMLRQGPSRSQIARALGRHPSTISRELRRNHASPATYVAERAQRRYGEVRRESRRTTSLSYLPLQRYLFDKMTEGWSPEQISGRLWRDHPGQPRMRVSPETIYRSLYRDEKLGRPLLGYLRQRRPRRRPRGERRPTRPRIPNRVGIEQRPPEVETLQRYGDWEGDLLVGADQQGAVLTLVERKSLLLRAALLPSRHAEGVAQAIIDQLHALPPEWRRTLTFDNGSEFTHHERVAATLDLDTYFAHPYAAYERARNENLNGLLRQYLPKSTNFTQIAPQILEQCVHQINQRPRKILGYQSPSEVHLQQTCALTV